MSDGYTRKRARTRRRLIESGMVVLARTGPAAMTVAEVAAGAEVSPGTFYNHFSSLDELIDAITGGLLADLEAAGAVLGVGERDPALRLAAGADRLLGLVEQDARAAAALVRLVPTVPSFRTGIRGLVAEAITEGVEAGRFRRAEVEVVADACLGAMMQWMRSDLAGETVASDRRARLEVILTLVGLASGDHDSTLDAALAPREIALD